MLDEQLAHRCPRPTNAGAWVFLVLGLGTLVTIGATLAVPISPGSGFAPCWTSTAPNPLSGAFCATLAVLVGLLPIWGLLPPTRRAVEQDERTLTWDRPAWPTAVRVAGTMVLLLLLGSSVSALQDHGLGWMPEAGRDCSIAPPHIQREKAGRQDLFVGWSLAAGLGALALSFWASRSLRPTGRIRLDELGLELDGVRWSYKDIERAEVSEGSLRFGRFDGEVYALTLFDAERAFAEQLAATVTARLPAAVEDRAEARAALAQLAEVP